MGMYDIVKHEDFCPYCNNLLIDWQTKELSDTLSTFKIDELWNGCEIHTICNHCKNYISMIVNHLVKPIIKTKFNNIVRVKNMLDDNFKNISYKQLDELIEHITRNVENLSKLNMPEETHKYEIYLEYLVSVRSGL